MRLQLVALVFVVGCMQQDQTGSDPGWGVGPGGQGGASNFGCEQDSDCGNQVCARDGECLPASAVRVIHVTWTVQQQAASDTACASAPDLDITFGDGEEEFGFSPVPCNEGKFTIDKLPTVYDAVSLIRTGDEQGGHSIYGGASGSLDPVTGDLALNLSY